MKFFICSHCGNIVTKVRDRKVPVVCCGEKMQEIVPGTTDAATEKHIPVYEVSGDTLSVTVGSVEHPMAEEHYIEWICVEYADGFDIKYLKPGEAPRAAFATGGRKVVGVYEYCNLHSLWKA